MVSRLGADPGTHSTGELNSQPNRKPKNDDKRSVVERLASDLANLSNCCSLLTCLIVEVIENKALYCLVLSTRVNDLFANLQPKRLTTANAFDESKVFRCSAVRKEFFKTGRIWKIFENFKEIFIYFTEI